MSATAKIIAFPAPAKEPCIDPDRRGLIPLYYLGEANRCPGCMGRAWIVGRLSAECSGCGTALEFATSRGRG